MDRRTATYAAIILAFLCITIIAGSAVAMAAEKSMPGTSARAVVAFITETSPYGDWKMWPGRKPYYKGRHPHGALLTTYVNDTAYRGIEKKTGLADGSMVVKENYTPDRKLVAITVMYKVSGYNPDGGDWFWLKYAPGGEISAQGKVDACINCHMEAGDNDWIFTGAVR